MAFVEETYTLPSNGMIEGIPKEVTIRNITTKEEKLLLGSSADAFDDILKKCIVRPTDINFSDMIAADKFFLMFKLRIISYGPTYHVKVKCPNCGKEQEVKLDLDDLETFYLPETFEEPYDVFELPRSKVKLALKIPRLADIEAVNLQTKRYYKKFPTAEPGMEYIYNLMANIAQVDDKEVQRKADLQKIIEELPGYDSAYLKDRLSKLKVGLDTQLFHECASCGEDIDFTLPMTQEFFRPRFDD